VEGVLKIAFVEMKEAARDEMHQRHVVEAL
jgi:hypothetical protein